MQAWFINLILIHPRWKKAYCYLVNLVMINYGYV